MTTRFTGYTLGELQTARDIIYQANIGDSELAQLYNVLDTEIDRRKRARRAHLNSKTRIVLNNGQDGTWTLGTFCHNNELDFDEVREAIATTGKFVLPDDYTVTLA